MNKIIKKILDGLCLQDINLPKLRSRQGIHQCFYCCCVHSSACKQKKTYRNCMLSLVPAQLSITSDNFKWIQSTWTRNPALSTFLAHFLPTWITNHTLQKNHSDTNHQQANRHVSSCILGYVFFLISLFCCLFIVSPLRTAISRSPPQHPPHPSVKCIWDEPRWRQQHWCIYCAKFGTLHGFLSSKIMGSPVKRKMPVSCSFSCLSLMLTVEHRLSWVLAWALRSQSPGWQVTIQNYKFGFSWPEVNMNT